MAPKTDPRNEGLISRKMRLKPVLAKTAKDCRDFLESTNHRVIFERVARHDDEVCLSDLWRLQQPRRADSKSFQTNSLPTSPT